MPKMPKSHIIHAPPGAYVPPVPMIEIDGMDDPKVLETLRRIQVARLGRASGDQLATTQPAGEALIDSTDPRVIPAPADGVYAAFGADGKEHARRYLLKEDKIGFARTEAGWLMAVSRDGQSRLDQAHAPYEWRILRTLDASE